MDNLKSLVLPAFLGLAAGVVHGIISHQADLPMSLTEQLIESFTPAQTVGYLPQGLNFRKQ
ncbi:MAG: hypothetical protein AAGI69_00035 [Cyanobacteria bacterium P01_H01_bin.21]